ncbi:hypothetical protein [Mucilaginibacter ginkgonis]|uniref:Uncharacterized protein n=1 Tax=Mucilaginibacter ginkgonis TaxID=2682091 RepID=A0A6I4IMY0_9SPHI|nr:hypothetical protein [Mucilaginibacter ginkgonis]QQL49908.1 hypothetical protein GO620_000205 [Mucilaginibacter ginkgonis]
MLLPNIRMRQAVVMQLPTGLYTMENYYLLSGIAWFLEISQQAVLVCAH